MQPKRCRHCTAHCTATHLGLCGLELHKPDALELPRLAVHGQPHVEHSASLAERLGQLLAHLVLAQVLVKALDKDGGALGGGKAVLAGGACTTVQMKWKWAEAWMAAVRMGGCRVLCCL